LSNKVQFRPQNAKGPVHIRRNVESFDDPYIEDEQLPVHSVCKKCGGVYVSGRWYDDREDLPEKLRESLRGLRANVICPACQKQRDMVPGGVLRLSGSFIWDHKEEILNLIRNESGKALGVNPLERIMSMASADGEIEITTTNEKLAQKIGKALHKAYSGEISYKWGGDTKLARVNWYREE